MSTRNGTSESRFEAERAAARQRSRTTRGLDILIEPTLDNARRARRAVARWGGFEPTFSVEELAHITVSHAMVARMKTTLEISDAVLEEAKRVAAEEGTTLRALVEEGLRRALYEHRQAATFELRRASVGGRGLQPGVEEGSWEQIRDLVYEGRGA